MNNNRLLKVLVIILVLWNILLTYLYFNNRNSNTNDGETTINNYNVSGFSSDFTRIIEDVKSSVVTIESGNTISSGFVYSQDNEDTYIVSTYHGISDNINIIFDSGYQINGELVGYDIFSDIALIKAQIPFDVLVINIGDSDLLKEGEFLISISTPRNLKYQGSIGLDMVASKLRFIENEIINEEIFYHYYSSMIQLSDSYRSGSSGSPLFNLAGNVVAMCMMSDTSNVYFALPINEINQVVLKLLNNENYIHHLLKVNGSYINEMLNYEKNALGIGLEITDGMYINDVLENSELDLKAGDIIISINGERIIHHNDYLKAIISNNEELVVEVLRENNPLVVRGNIDD